MKAATTRHSRHSFSTYVTQQLALLIKDINSSGSLHTADHKHVQAGMPLCHERTQPSSRLVVVLHASSRLRGCCVFVARQVQVLKHVQRIVHCRTHNMLTRWRKADAVYRLAAIVPSDRLGLCVTSGAAVTKLADIPDFDGAVKTTRD
jgi:hypothetical protein